MVAFEKYHLDNGLTVILQQDTTTPMVATNVCYNVGSKDENPERTGFAHLFEHLMFGGSKNIANFHKEVELASGSENGFTSIDVTDYYITLPKQNLEVAFWLESDRMNELVFSPESLEIQRHVVIEEYKQSYLNQPYGDAMLLHMPLCYQKHPYLWMPIGKTPQHVEEATMEEVKAFFYTFYRPNNAVLTVSGNIQIEACKDMIHKWFSPILQGKPYIRNLAQEPLQTEPRYLDITRDVPSDRLQKAYKMGKRTDSEYVPACMLVDILSNGKSSRLIKKLKYENPIFSSINAYLLGSFDDGLLFIIGYTYPNIAIEDADKLVQEQLQLLCEDGISDYELQKVKNKAKTEFDYDMLDVQSKTMNLSINEVMSAAEIVNSMEEAYMRVTAEDIQQTARKIFNENRCSTLYYRAKK